MLIYNKTSNQFTTEKVRKPAEDEVVWIRLLTPGEQEIRHVLEDLFDCHGLLVEDCITLNQRPKMDRYTDNIFISFFSINEQYEAQEIALVIGPNYVISIYHNNIPVLNALYDELQQYDGKMHHSGQILYYILDRCVDEYVQLVDHIEDKVEEWEIAIHENPYAKIAQDVFRMKRIIHGLRRIFVEERTVIGSISHQKFPYMRPEADVYFVDVYDHISRVLDSVDIFRESLTGLLEMQVSMKSDRMNEIMKTLTIFSTIFLPLTFIAGVYGMNFKNIQEYDWSYGYQYVWGLMIVTVISMCFFFKRKRWW